MATVAAVVFGGFLLGLAGALHCAAMCGGIANGAYRLFSPEGGAAGVVTMASMLVGRVLTYGVLGALFAASADVMFAMLSFDVHSYRIMPWVAAVVLVWTGLSTAGFFPAFVVPFGSGGSFVARLDRALAPARRVPFLAPFVVGGVWGLAPCPLVYAALLTAALTGTASYGFLWMLGFGLGTIPAVVAAFIGLNFLAHINAGRFAKIAAGVAIAAFGVATVMLDLPVFSALCAPLPTT